MNTKLRQKSKSSFEKHFFKLINRNTMKNARKHRNIELVTTEKNRSYLVSKPNHHTAKFFREHSLAIEMIKTEILINKLVY